MGFFDHLLDWEDDLRVGKETRLTQIEQLAMISQTWICLKKKRVYIVHVFDYLDLYLYIYTYSHISHIYIYIFTHIFHRYLLHVTLFMIIPWSYFCCYHWFWFCCRRPQNVGPEVDSCVTGVTPASLVLTTEAVPLRCDVTVMAGQPIPPSVPPPRNSRPS